MGKCSYYFCHCQQISENCKRNSKNLSLMVSFDMENLILDPGTNCIDLGESTGTIEITKGEAIAVVGMACRFPSANNLWEYWEVLKTGKNVVREQPPHRWIKLQQHGFLQDDEKVQAGFLSVPIDEFDAKFFEVSPMEAASMDPQHRLLMEVVWESFEDAAINPQKMRGIRGGVFLGSWLNQYKEILQLDDNDAASNFYKNYKGTCVGVGAARISQLLGWTGPCIGTESDCSAGLISVSMACKSLQNNDCSVAVASGVNILVTPFTVDNLPAVLSPDFRCKTFDESANGFARAEGVGALVLKRYSDAVRDGDKIWGLIRGSAVSQEGMNSSMGTPTVCSQMEAMALALKDGGVDPANVSYVEAHGTGTKVGDPVEMEAISKIYGKGIKREGLLTIGSVKTNLGHTESCSGIAGLIKVLLSMKNEAIPPHINLKNLNSKIKLEEMNATIPLDLVPWPKVPGHPRMAGVSSFGLAGKNCHVILEEALNEVEISKEFTAGNGSKVSAERPFHILKIAAKSPPALEELLDKYINLCGEQSVRKTCNFAEFAYTSNVGRADFSNRAVILAKDFESAREILKTGSFEKNEINRKSRICFLFTGQGSQYQGMAKELYETSPVFRSDFDFCSGWLQSNYNISIKDTYFQGVGQPETVNRTLYSQTGIFVVEYCLMRLWQSWGVKPQYVLGHSLGEFCAATCAGILDIKDALKLVAERSRLIESVSHGKMLVIKANKKVVDKLQKEFFSSKKAELDYAAFNAEDQTVVAGCPELVNPFQEFLKSQKNMKCTLLQSTHAFHSRDMDPILQEYGKTARTISCKGCVEDITFISGMLGEVIKGLDTNYWTKHTRNPVNFMRACKALKNLREDDEELVYLEIGPHPVLSALVLMNGDKNSSSLCLPSLRKNNSDWKTIFGSLAKLYVYGGVHINWVGVNEGCTIKKVGHLLPTYPFQRIKYWPKIASSLSKKKLHPLLGSMLLNPTNTTIFQSQIPSSSLQLEYLKEHKLGDKIIFPGAGYIEMMLAAGLVRFFGAQKITAKLQYPSVQLNNIQILTPLELNEDFKEGRKTCQTTLQEEIVPADKEPLDGCKISIYHIQQNKENDSGGNIDSSKWINHATASFYPSFEANLDFNPVEEEDHQFLNTLLNHSNKENNISLISHLQSSLGSESLIDSFYKPHYTVGLKLEEPFRTLQKVSKCWETRQFLAELLAPKTKEKNMGIYFLHPIIIDAMMQVAGFPHFDEELASGKKPTLLVPVGCKKFIWIKALKTRKCFIYSPNHDLGSTLLLDEDGALVAAVYKVDMTSTSVKGIRAVLEKQLNSLPGFYKYHWKKTGSQARFNFGGSLKNILLSPENLKELDRNPYGLSNDLNRLATLYITRALVNMGWSAKTFKEKELHNILGVVTEQKKLFSHLLSILVDDGILTREKGCAVDEDTYQIRIDRQKLFNLTNLDSEVKLILKKYLIDDSSSDNGTIVPEQVPFLFLQQIGQQLEKFLKGEAEALSVLFPTNPPKNSVTAPMYYKVKRSAIHTVLSSALGQLWAGLKAKNEENGRTAPTLRILEVGAGTGAGTFYFLKSLKEGNIPFEYVYTDLSSSFFSAAEKKFAEYKDSMKFTKFNLEEDPTSQGFPPGYFDVVLAVHVIHATRDIKESLLNIRKLMVDGGTLWMSEIIEKDPLLDCTFGLLDGFWRFTDFELRPNHCMLTVEKWRQVTMEMGFYDFQYFQDESMGLLVCKADEFGATKSGPFELQKRLCSLVSREVHFNVEKHPKWIITYMEPEKDYVARIVKYFNLIGRKRVVLVKVNASETTNSEPFKALSKETSCAAVEGIIVTWGLGSSHNELTKLYLNFIQYLLKLAKERGTGPPPVVLLTKGQYPVGDIICPDPISSTLIGVSICAINEHKELKLKILDFGPAEDTDSTLWNVFQEIFANFEKEVRPICVFRNENNFSPKLETIKLSRHSLSLPIHFKRFQLVLPLSNTIQDLKFGSLPQFLKLKNNEIEVKVVCSALNFRDVLCVLKPISYFANRHNIGVDFAGIITQVGSSVGKWKKGDKVFGCHLINQPLISHVQIEEDQVDFIPPSFTFAEAATLPLVFSTAHYALVKLAKTEKGQTILIHAASGGVGLAAIQIARHLELQIICTAGSERKRAYLKSLGITHVFNSRNTEFSKQVLEVLEGKGVDIVLNSLTGPGLKEATLEACAYGARFIEISKINIFTEKEMSRIRPDIKYSIIDPTDFEKIIVAKQYASVAAEWVQNGKIQPIPYTRFDAGDIKDALSYLQKAKHIGKVVISMPDRYTTNETKEIPLFNGRSTYLITGGLGGIGLEVCKYMVEQGARFIVLVGRSPPPQKVLEVLESLNKLHNSQVIVLQGDIGNKEDCERIFQHIAKNLPYPLRGIMHAAGTLSDGLIENLSWEDFEKTFCSKVEGSWNLHELTKDLNLEHFVLFSSVAAKLATPGQATHVSACTFQDTLAHYRNSHGLPATTINWGQWAEVGVAKNLEIKFVLPFSLQQGIRSLDLVLRKNLTSATVVNLPKNLRTISDAFPYMKATFDQKLFQTISSTSKSTVSEKLNSDSFWAEYNSSGNSIEDEDKLKTCIKFLEQLLRNVLRVDPRDSIDIDADLSVMGMDSLIMIELLNLMQTLVGKRLTIPKGSIKDSKTLKSLASGLMDVIEEKWKEVPAPTLGEVRDLSLLDVPLSADIIIERPGSEVAPSQIKTLLVTGVTGFVGSNLLKELLESCPQLERFYCLVRGKDLEKRFVSVMERNRIRLDVEGLQKRVRFITGDFILPNLGLTEEDYLKKCKEVDGIFHLGAMVHHSDYYRNVPGGSKDVRSVNVGGLLNILRFACKGKTKHVFYTSTLFTTSWNTGKDGRLLETWPSMQRLASLGTSMGYPISKMICELHLKQAVEERGIPVKVFRCCTFRASTTSGKSFAEGTHLMRLILLFLKESFVSDDPTPINIVPVDVAVKIMTSLSFNDEAPNEVFHLSHPRPLLLRDCIPQLAKDLGRPMSMMSTDEATQRLLDIFETAKKNFEKDGTAAALKKAMIYDLRLIYQDRNLFNFLQSYGNEAWEGWKECQEFWASKKLERFVPEVYAGIEHPLEILKRDVRAAIQEGLLD